MILPLATWDRGLIVGVRPFLIAIAVAIIVAMGISIIDVFGVELGKHRAHQCDTCKLKTAKGKTGLDPSAGLRRRPQNGRCCRACNKLSIGKAEQGRRVKHDKIKHL